jgi:methyl-accepting chemotaxis protein
MLKLITFFQKLRLSLRYKVGLAFGVLLVCFVINGIISIVLLLTIRENEENQRLNSIFLERVQRLEIAYQNELNSYADVLFYNKSTVIRNNFRNSIIAEFDFNSHSETRAVDSEFQVKFGRLYNSSLDIFLGIEDNIRKGNLPEAVALWQNSGSTFEAASNLLKTEKQTLTAANAAGKQYLEHDISLSISLIVGLTALSILLALFILFLFERAILHPLNKIQQGLNQVAEGDLNQQISVPNKDEIGKLANSFGMAINSLQKVISGVQIGESLKKVTTDLSIVSQQQTSGTNAQVSALTEVIATMQELGNTAGQIATNAHQVADLTGVTMEQIEKVSIAGRVSKEQAGEMVRVVEATMTGVELVSAKVNSFKEVIDEWQEKTASVATVVQLLNSIADDIHLLALNASIEAAGAGIYGERFRVVAQAIKQLAGRANTATIEARTLIKDVQQSGQNAQKQVEEGQAEVGKIVESNTALRENLFRLERSTQEVETAVIQLVDLAGEVNSQTDMIKLATMQQLTASEQVIIAARSAGEMAQQNASSTQQVATNSTALESLTAQLNGVLRQVKMAA